MVDEDTRDREHVIWYNVCSPRLRSVNADMTTMEKRTAVNDAARTLQEIQNEKHLCGNLPDKNLRKTETRGVVKRMQEVYIR